MEQYYPIRDAIHERLLKANICSSHYLIFLRHRNNINKLVKMLIENMDYMLDRECISESELICLLDDPQFKDMPQAYGSVLAWAIKRRRVAFLDWFITRNELGGFYPDATYWAAKLGYTDILLVLISHGSDIAVWNHAPLRYAAANGNLDTVERLVALGADITADNNGAVRYAEQNGHSDVVQYLSGIN